MAALRLEREFKGIKSTETTLAEAIEAFLLERTVGQREDVEGGTKHYIGQMARGRNDH